MVCTHEIGKKQQQQRRQQISSFSPQKNLEMWKQIPWLSAFELEITWSGCRRHTSLGVLLRTAIQLFYIWTMYIYKSCWIFLCNMPFLGLLRSHKQASSKFFVEGFPTLLIFVKKKIIFGSAKFSFGNIALPFSGNFS